MSQQKTELDKITCEAYGCFAAAGEEITVPVGQTGEINLSVCSNCRPKFIANRSGYDGKQEKLRHSGSMVATRDQSVQITPPPANWSDMNG